MAEAQLAGLIKVQNNKTLIRRDTLALPELFQLFKSEHTSSEIPFRPKGGDVIVFKNSDGKKDDWKADGHS